MPTEVGPIEVGEIKALRFDFATEMEAENALASASVAITLIKGVDANPAALLVGVATLAGRQVVQRIQAGALGNVYRVRATATDSAGLAHVVSAILRVDY